MPAIALPVLADSHDALDRRLFGLTLRRVESRSVVVPDTPHLRCDRHRVRNDLPRRLIEQVDKVIDNARTFVPGDSGCNDRFHRERFALWVDRELEVVTCVLIRQVVDKPRFAAWAGDS